MNPQPPPRCPRRGDKIDVAATNLLLASFTRAEIEHLLAEVLSTPVEGLCFCPYAEECTCHVA